MTTIVRWPKKSLGQNFLVDKNIIRKIMEAAAIEADEHVLEIGPGRGALTGELLKAGARVLAVEFDKSLAEELRSIYGSSKNFELIEADALKLDFSELAREYGTPFKVVSNLPYNISGPLLARVIEQRQAFTGLVLMLQREVAERLLAPPSTKEYGALTVLTRTFAGVERLFQVSPGCFRPRPKVQSTVIRLVPLDSPRVEVHDPGLYRRVVKAAFGQRRKTLANALKALDLGPDAPPGAVDEALSRAGIDPKRRGETLGLEEFSTLTKAFLSVQGPGD